MPSAVSGLRSPDALLEACRAAGETDEAYLRFHWGRFQATRELIADALDRRNQRAVRVLDVGARWLHQALLLTADGHEVVATELTQGFGRR
ncbi:hypothetical protein R0137_08205 [Congregibacter brevis]|uniref:Uncharacterized protein n=1 Tax=Congregibacter brevis TaxID=3081201 RepID=A0ABZ0IG96_9GAMM|nr:hypothetical protein R0137_08205 [Congregibacter sp. IMCC45268]